MGLRGSEGRVWDSPNIRVCPKVGVCPQVWDSPKVRTPLLKSGPLF